jgi:hypothetical protein
MQAHSNGSEGRPSTRIQQSPDDEDPLGVLGSRASGPNVGAFRRSSEFLFTRRRESSPEIGDGRGTPSAAPAC